jgi:hypothetical protein
MSKSQLIISIKIIWMMSMVASHDRYTIAIMGEYWWDQWDLSKYAHWKTKMVRLDMAVDATRYPRVKEII